MGQLELAALIESELNTPARKISIKTISATRLLTPKTDFIFLYVAPPEQKSVSD